MSAKYAHVVVLGNEKGGSGKSTAAMHLIVATLRDGRSVASVDLDARQGTLTRYLANRRDFARAEGLTLPMPAHYAVDRRNNLPLGAPLLPEERDRLKLLLDGATIAHDLLVIDTPGSDSELSRFGHSFADTLITPINDSLIDFDVLAHVDPRTMTVKAPSHYSEMVWRAKQERAERGGGSIDWIVMRNRLSHLDARNKREIERLMRDFATRLGCRIAEGLAERVIYRELFLHGLTMMDLPDVKKGAMSMSHVAARQEVRALIEAIRLP
ncbi:MAG: ATPase, partial [Rhodospirillales bacterium]|nr:ATPase [Rhodospirillales bacterium]